MPDDATIVEGDAGFIGMASRLNPLQLQPGMVQYVENMRLDRGVAQTRKGAKRLAENINPATDLLVLDFTLGSDRSIASLSQSGGTATAVFMAPHNMPDQSWVNIRGAAQAEYNNDFQITTTSPTEFTFSIAPLAAANAGGAPIVNRGPVVKTTYGGDIIGAGVYSSPRFDNGREYIALASPSVVYLWREGSSSVESLALPLTDTLENGDDVEIIQAFEKLYILRTRESEMLRLDELEQAAGVAAATTLDPHGYAVGEVVRISGAGQAGFLGDFEITGVPSATTFEFSVPSGTTSPATGILHAQRVQPALVWDGDLANDFARVQQGTHPLGVTFSRLPSTSIATYFNNQLVVAKGRDEVLVSDVFDGETYDPVSKSFRANFGSNDFIVAIHPYAESQALIFCRNSIYIATIGIGPDGVSIDPANSSLQLLTNEIGCSARRSIVTAGVYVFFLSDNGVYRLDNQFDLKLRGNTQPLSDPIDNLLEGINSTAVAASNAVYFNNRYYLAVPVGESTTPNAVLCYNMLNQAWETKDTYEFSVDRLLISTYGKQRRLFASNRYGTLFLLDEEESGMDDAPTGGNAHQVVGTLTTRRYGFGSMNAKRLLRTKASVVLPAGAACAISAITQDYDQIFQTASLSNTGSSEEDYTVKAPLRCKATSLDLEFRTTSGRPILRQISAEATRSGQDNTETRTLN